MLSNISIGIALLESTVVSGTKKASLRPRVALIHFEGKPYLLILFLNKEELIMVCTCPAKEFATDTYLLKLQLLYKVLRIIGSFPRRPPIRRLRVAFEIPCGYDFIKGGRKAGILHSMMIKVFVTVDD
jgi:hypothetical protein